MKKHIILLYVFIVFLGGCSKKQEKAIVIKSSDTVKTRVVSLSPVDSINLEIEKIKSDKSKDNYSIKKIDLMGFSTEGGVATFYREPNGEIRFLEVVFYGEGGKSTEEYYFYKNNLIFKENVKETYNAPIYMKENKSSESTIEKDQYYFRNKYIILWIDANNKRHEQRNNVVVQKEKETMKFVSSILKKK